MSVLFKIIFISIVSTHVVESASLICYLGSINNTKELPLEQAPEFLNTPYIKADRELIIITHGYSAEISVYHETVIINFMNRYGDTKCYCSLNWKKEASGYIGFLTDPIKKNLGVQILLFDYVAVAVIASKIGKILGAVLAQLKIAIVTLIGHSQGALLFGDAGRELYRITKGLIAVIIGLDPAKPPVERALDTTCASFVWCVHTNPDLFGTNEAKCHVDFWLNCGCKLQPGCPPSIQLTNDKILCSHIRAILIMADAVKYPDSLPGRKASSCDVLGKSGNDSDTYEVNYIGPNIQPSIHGSFFLNTNAASPFGQGSAGMDPANRTCEYDSGVF